MPSVHNALAQVQALQRFIGAKQRFRGYSGKARIISGVMALVGASFLNSTSDPLTHLFAWLVVLVTAFAINFGAVAVWFLNDPAVNRRWSRLRPVLDVVPPLLVGGLFTAALVLRGQYDLLFGTWMCLFGLANIASRHVLPRAIGRVGIFYMAAGGVCLLHPMITFADAWVMGGVFFVGELVAGIVLQVDRRRDLGEVIA
jgi:hypothetical protein